MRKSSTSLAVCLIVLCLTLLFLSGTAIARASRPTGVSVTATATTCTNPSGWTVVAPLPWTLWGAANDSDGTYLYVAGGNSHQLNRNLSELLRYDPAANTWTQLQSMPASAFLPLGVFAEGKFYVFGGRDPAGTPLNTTRIYDPATNTWSSGAVMPAARYVMGGAYANGRIYVIGGGSPSAQAQNWEYTLATNTWATRASLPIAISGPAVEAFNQHLYVIGGDDYYDVVLRTVYDYDLAANTWTRRADMPSARNYPGRALVGGRIWVFGGGNPGLGPTTTNVTEIYDIAANTWTSGPAQNVARGYQASGLAGTTIVSAGGGYNTFDYNTTEVLRTVNPCTPTPTATSANTPTPPPDTPTATGTPAICPGPVVLNGSLTHEDPQQRSRLFRDGTPDSCDGAGLCDTFGGGTRAYDAYPFINNTNTRQCITVVADSTGCQANHFMFVATYRPAFDPQNICTDWQADIGVSPNPVAGYSFSVGPYESFTLVASEVNNGEGCNDYTLTVTANACLTGDPGSPPGPFSLSLHDYRLYLPGVLR